MSTYNRRFTSLHTLSCRTAFVLISILLFAALSFGQGSGTNVVEGWVRIESPAKDFSFAVPSTGYLVDNEDGAYRILYRDKGRSFNIDVEKRRDAKETFRFAASWYEGHDPKYKTFQSGDFLGRWYQDFSEKSDNYYYWFQLASSHGLYSVNVRAKSADLDFAKRLVRSIRLNNKRVYDSMIVDPPEANTLAIESLKTDEVILKALHQPEPKDLQLEKDPADSPSADPEKITYSRGVLVLRRPRALYTDAARRKSISGVVKLKVTLLATGTVGPIKVVTSLDKGLDQRAFEAAKKIKFLPAEIDGKTVDVTVYFEYTFTVY